MAATSGNICNAIIQKKTKHGYTILVEKKILGFIPNSIVDRYNVDLNEEFSLEVKCIKNNEESETPVFEIFNVKTNIT
jgi:ribosomal protein S1